MKYYGRGSVQLSESHNYGQFSHAMFGDGRLLLDYPDFVADTWLNFASTVWFYITPHLHTPSLLHVVNRSWKPNSRDLENGLRPGFGSTINIRTGGKECGTRDGSETQEASNRSNYFKHFAWYLFVDYEEDELQCGRQGQFTEGGSASVPLYWDKDEQLNYACKLVFYHTSYNALIEKDYVLCVEDNFNIRLSFNYFQVLEDQFYKN